MIITIFWFESKEDRINLLMETLTQVNLDLKDASKLEKDFFAYETINEQFYLTGESAFLTKRHVLNDEIRKRLETLKHLEELENIDIEHNIDDLIYRIEEFNLLFDSLVSLTYRRGFKDYGMEGEMRKCIHEIEHSAYLFDISIILTIRRHEKDFIIRKEERYVKKLLNTIFKLRESLAQKTDVDDQERKRLNELLTKYTTLFLNIVDIEKHIGFDGNTGVKRELHLLERDVEKKIHEINNRVFVQVDEIGTKIKLILLLVMLIGISLNIASAYIILNKLGRPIIKLSETIRHIITNKFEDNDELLEISSNDEIGLLAQDFNVMLTEVRAKTQEIKEQNLVVSEAYENIKLLSKMGQDIASHLDMNVLIQKVYKSVNSLMRADNFGIGVFDESSNTLIFTDYIENGETLPDFNYSLDENSRLAVWCFNHKEEVFLNDMLKQHKDFALNIATPKEGKDPMSVIFLPLRTSEKVIGVLTVQSLKRNAYTEYHFNLLKNLAAYITTALENAYSFRRIAIQSNEIEAKSMSIEKSINYAKRIQEAILPSIDEIKNGLPESFVFFKPRDKVSGDFYWYAEVGSKMLIAAADCTGHGVPGAIMSMIGNDLLNQIVKKENILSGKEILRRLSAGITSALKQDETDNKDGMDIALCVIDKGNGNEAIKVEFAGAKNPLVYVQNNEVFQIKGDKTPIGGLATSTQDATFTSTELIIDQPTSFYLFSDGYQDQFGGERNKKFMIRRLKNLFVEIHDMPSQHQKDMLNDTLIDWMEDEEQVDDILVIGFRLVPPLK